MQRDEPASSAPQPPDAVPAPEEAGGSVAAGSALLFGAQVVGNVGFFVAVLILARGLTTAGRGTVAFITVTAVVTSRALQLGVGQATTVLAAQRPEARRSILANVFLFMAGSAILGGIAVAAILFALPGVRPGGLGNGELLVLALATVANSLVDAGATFLYGLGRFRDWARIAAFGPWLYAGLLGACWAFAGLSVLRAVIAWTVAHATWGVLVLLASRRGVGVGRPDRALLGESMRFGVRAWVGTLSRFLNFRVDQILMGFISTESTLGVYAIAVNASEVPLYLPNATQFVLTPAIARAEEERRLDQTLETFRALFVITGLVIVGAAIVGGPLIPLAFGASYRDSIVPYLCLLPGTLGFAASGVFSAALLGSSKPGLSSLGPLFSVVSGFALDLVLIPPYGATGAAIAASIAYIGGGITALVAFRRLNAFGLSRLVPRRADVAALGGIFRALLGRLRGR